ncbi:MAG: hypothetical protein DRZ90_11935 [Spirochaetes bacterium]|nr:MAG: hypothetical protein DRZ90_11935 [Spirochaetota bacterium]
MIWQDFSGQIFTHHFDEKYSHAISFLEFLKTGNLIAEKYLDIENLFNNFPVFFPFFPHPILLLKAEQQA